MMLTAYAKINLTLEVLGKRADGYHEIASVLHTIGLSDRISMEPAGEITFGCNVPELETSDNLVLKAAKLLRDTTGCSKGASIRLAKNTPLASGLGAGSSDAAACLIGLNELWQLGLSRDKLADIAGRLGSDVPFFLHGGAALARGRGEQITPLHPVTEFWLAFLEPAVEPVANKTARLYSLLKPSHFTSGEHTRNLIERLETGSTIDDALLFNVFEQVAFGFFPGLEGYRDRFLSAGAASVHLAGAGPTLFALAHDRSHGEQLLARLMSDNLTAYLAPSVPVSVDKEA